jgi:hypothetical protein
VLTALLVGLICWQPAIIDEATGHPGNLTLVTRTATTSKPTLGLHVGENAVARALGVRPWWLIDPATRWDRKYDVVAPQGRLRVITTIALLGALGAIVIVGVLRRRRDLATAGAIGLVLCAALASVAADTPTTPVLAATVAYSLWWGSQCGMWVWLIVAWSAFLLVRARAPAPARWMPAAAVPAGLAAVAAIATTEAAAEKPDQHVALYRPITTIDARVNAAIPPGEPIRYDGNLDVATLPVKASIRYDLVRHGDRVLSNGAWFRNGRWYELDHHPYDATVTLTDRRRRPGRGAALLIRVGYTERGLRSSVYVWMTRSPRRPAAPSAARRASHLHRHRARNGA